MQWLCLCVVRGLVAPWLPGGSHLDLDDVLVRDVLSHLHEGSQAGTGRSQADAQNDEGLHAEWTSHKREKERQGEVQLQRPIPQCMN